MFVESRQTYTVSPSKLFFWFNIHTSFMFLHPNACFCHREQIFCVYGEQRRETSRWHLQRGDGSILALNWCRSQSGDDKDKIQKKEKQREEGRAESHTITSSCECIISVKILGTPSRWYRSQGFKKESLESVSWTNHSPSPSIPITCNSEPTCNHLRLPTWKYPWKVKGVRLRFGK